MPLIRLDPKCPDNVDFFKVLVYRPHIDVVSQILSTVAQLCANLRTLRLDHSLAIKHIILRSRDGSTTGLQSSGALRF